MKNDIKTESSADDTESTQVGEVTATTTEEERVILKRIDRFLLPVLIFSYLLQYLDKSSLGNSAVLGIIKDAKLVGQDFSWLSAAFYFGQLIGNYPASFLMVKYPLGKVIAAFVICWSIVLACFSASTSFIALCTLRVLLGMFESAVGPGFVLVTGMWYKPSEHAFRHGLWFVGNSLGGMFGSLIAWGCAHVSDGLLAQWQVLFIALGCLTFVWGILLLWILPDTPLKARFLTSRQREIAERRPQANMHSFKTNKFSKEQTIEALCDPKSWFIFAIITLASLTNGATANFNTIIIKSLGFDTLTTLLLGLPVAGTQLIIILGSTYAAHKIRKSRCILLFSGYAIAVVGVVLIRQLPSSNKRGRYVGVLLILGSSVVFPLLLSIISSNIGGFTKKATVNAIFFIGYCAGNIAGPQLFILKEAPKYNTSFTSILVLFCIVAFLCIAFRQYLDWENKRRDREQGVYIDPEPTKALSEGEESQLIATRLEETDWQNKKFRYYL